MLRSNDELRSINNGLIQDNIIRISQATRSSFIEMYNGGVADLSYPTSKNRRGRVQGGGTISPTITSSASGIHKIDRKDITNMDTITRNELIKRYKIRKLTPKEVGRLMDVSDDDIDAILSVSSNSAAYKMFGNSIVVNCLTAILGQLFPGKEDTYKELEAAYV